MTALEITYSVQLANLAFDVGRRPLNPQRSQSTVLELSDAAPRILKQQDLS